MVGEVVAEEGGEGLGGGEGGGVEVEYDVEEFAGGEGGVEA